MGEAALNAESESDVVRKHDKDIAYLAGRFRVDRDDLVQIGRLALLEALRVWQTKPQTSSFWTYARKHVFGEMVNYVTERAQRADIEERYGLVPQPLGGPPDSALEAKEAVAALADLELKILLLSADGFSAREICAEVGESKSEAHRILSGTIENIRSRT